MKRNAVMERLTKDEAIALYNSKFWEPMSLEERFRFQLFESLLCMPFDVFHEAAEAVLGRPVYTHEFADQEANIQEYLGQRPAPTLEEIIALIPEEKRIIIWPDDHEAFQ